MMQQRLFPMEDETRFLFKEWDMIFSPHLGSNKNFNYEFVEIMSDYVVAFDVRGAYLDKVKGTTCLFHRVGDRFLVSAKDLLRFSHQNSFSEDYKD